jgi:hypothetical protein
MNTKWARLTRNLYCQNGLLQQKTASIATLKCKKMITFAPTVNAMLYDNKSLYQSSTHRQIKQEFCHHNR